MDGFDMTAGETTALDYRTSPEMGAMFGALAKAQGEIKNAAKDAANPHFKSKYADLASISDACRTALSKNGIAVVQIPHNDGKDIALTTILGHSSGQWISGKVCVAPAKWDAQSVGSVVTYLRRYSLAAMAGVAPGDDDDCEAAVGRGNGDNRATVTAPTNGAKHPEEPWRVSANTIKAAIDAAPHLVALNALMEQKGVDAKSKDPRVGSDLEFIRTASAEAYAFLLDRAQKRRGMFLNEPGKAA